MGKIEIKSIGIMIMILLNFAKLVLSHGFFCQLKCRAQCVFKGFTQEMFEKCVNDCMSHCSLLSNNPFYNCISNCHLMKSGAIKNGALDIINNEMNTCIQKLNRYYNL
ncbi:hypothetical protein V8G54_037481 [Vigna mungo]|uniref:Uncharacterized protein n=1 Tax=Vigna mungo TaxID=3915 RepID=A0AAQ3MIZ5_VIGMU